MEKRELIYLSVIVAIIGAGLFIEIRKQQPKPKPVSFTCGFSADTTTSWPYRVYYYTDAKTASFVLLDTLAPPTIDRVWDAMNWPNEDKPDCNSTYTICPYLDKR